METPPNASICPTVGANCRGGITADAIGMAKMGPNGRWGNPGRVYALKKCTRKNTQEHEQRNKKARTQSTPRCTLLRGPLVEVTPLLQHYPSQCIAQSDKYKLLLELYDDTMVRT